jgi:hypothetical protein
MNSLNETALATGMLLGAAAGPPTVTDANYQTLYLRHCGIITTDIALKWTAAQHHRPDGYRPVRGCVRASVSAQRAVVLERQGADLLGAVRQVFGSFAGPAASAAVRRQYAAQAARERNRVGDPGSSALVADQRPRIICAEASPPGSGLVGAVSASAATASAIPGVSA